MGGSGVRAGMARRLAAVALALLAVTLVATPLASAQADDGADETNATANESALEDCAVVTESGTYELADDVTNATANVTAANETNASDGVNVTGAADADATDDAETDDAATPDADDANETAAGDETAANVTNEFTLENDSAVACVAIRADDVTFEGNGFDVDGTVAADGDDANETADAANDTGNATRVGVAVVAAEENESVRNVSIRNVTVTDWDVGVYVENPRNVTFHNLSALDNREGAIRVVNETDANESAAANADE